MNYIIGCPCGKRIRIEVKKMMGTLRCENCHRYIRLPSDLPLLPKNTNLIGKILVKRFRIESYLGGGGMGRVYRATDLLMNRVVAIKIIKKNLTTEKSFSREEKRFFQEASISSQLNHPAIVAVRSFHKSPKGVYFMIMDFCSGISLQKLLQEKGLLEIEQAIDITVQILQALQIAHDKGIVHRDIKPANIMIESKSDKNYVKILDFGIAKTFLNDDFVSLTRTGYIMGSPKYMAPEQIVNKNIDHQTDLYAIGVVLYQMISGSLPFHGSKEKILYATLHAPPASLKKVCKKQGIKVPWFLNAIISKALAKNKKDRFKDVSHFLKALNLFQNSTHSMQKNIAWLFQEFAFQKIFFIILGFFVIFFLPLLFSPQASASKEEDIAKFQKMLKNEEYEKAIDLLKNSSWKNSKRIEQCLEKQLQKGGIYSSKLLQLLSINAGDEEFFYSFLTKFTQDRSPTS